MPRLAPRARLAPLLLSAALSACGAGTKLALVDQAMKLEHPDVPTVDVAEAKALVDSGALWVDVRTDAERSVSRIPGALDGESILSDRALYRDRVLVAYCTVGVRSAEWAAARRAEGLDVRNLRGSIIAWARAGEPLVAPSGAPTRRVHTWSSRYDWLPQGYEGVTEPVLK